MVQFFTIKAEVEKNKKWVRKPIRLNQMTDSTDTTPTRDVADHIQILFDYFNASLFSSELPTDCMLTFATFGRSKAYFTPSRWKETGREKTAHELSLNPTLFNDPKEIALAWLVRLQVQLFQSEHGIDRSLRSLEKRYYNREFSDKMAAIGLPCSSDGTPEGEKTGYTMQHWIEEGGAYEQAVKAMPDEYFPWKGDLKPKAERKKPYTYLCTACGARFTIPSYLVLKCMTKGCDQLMDVIQGTPPSEDSENQMAT